MTDRAVEERHRILAAKMFACFVHPAPTNAMLNQYTPALERAAQALANAEPLPAPSAPAEFDPGESPSFGLETWRGPLGLVRLVLRGREHVGYRALGPMQQMPREDFERVFTKCVSPTIEELKVKGPVPAESPQPKARGDGWKARAEALHQEALDLRALERLVRRYLGERGMIATTLHPALHAVLSSIDRSRAEYPLPEVP